MKATYKQLKEDWGIHEPLVAERIINQSRIIGLKQAHPDKFHKCFKAVWKVVDAGTLRRECAADPNFERAVKYVMEE